MGLTLLFSICRRTLIARKFLERRIHTPLQRSMNHNYKKQIDRDIGPITRIVRKLVNANPGLKINRRIDFPCIKMYFAAYVLCTLRLFKSKTEGQTV